MALTTLAVVKEEVGKSDSSLDDIITRHIAAVGTAFRDAIGRPIETESIVEWLDGPGVPELVLRYFPIVTVTAITEDGVAVAGGDLLLRADRGVVVRFPNELVEDWSKGTLNIKAEYDAGWATVPEDIADAATKQVVYQLRRTAPFGGRIGERSFATGENATTVYMVDALLPSVREVLARYRHPRGL